MRCGLGVGILPDDPEREFRAEVARRLEMRKGNLAAALEEAVRGWMAAKKK